MYKYVALSPCSQSKTYMFRSNNKVIESKLATYVDVNKYIKILVLKVRCLNPLKIRHILFGIKHACFGLTVVRGLCRGGTIYNTEQPPPHIEWDLVLFVLCR